MAGKTLLETPFLEILPRALRDDADVVAFAKTVDVMLALIVPQIRNVLIWSRIDELEEPLLSNLAYQMHLEGYEGWHLAETVEQKRRLVKEAYITHFFKGTRWSLERVFELLDIPGEVTEWWEAPAEDFPPYTFDMDLYAYDRRVSRTFYFDCLNLIEALKNERSHLRRGTVHIKSEAAVYFGAGMMVSSTVTVGPRVAKAVTVRAAVPYVGGGSRVTQAVTVAPRVPSSVAFLGPGRLRVMSGVQVAQTVTLNPVKRTNSEDGGM